jgi:uncharacterized protein YbjQ (UPF0145 family)
MLRPLLTESGADARGAVVIGTTIGNDLVAGMRKGAGRRIGRLAGETVARERGRPVR